MTKKCFIISEIGKEKTIEREKYEGFLSVILPVLESLNYKVIRPDANDSGSIMAYIIEHLFKDEMVVANLTGYNPNVMYELGVRHAFEKPVVCVVEKDNQPFPFDIKDFRIVQFEDKISKSEEFRKNLKEMILSAENNPSTNPISIGIKAMLSIDKEKEKENAVSVKEESVKKVKNLILKIEPNSEDMPSRFSIWAPIKQFYKDNGKNVSLLFYSQTTGQIEIKEGFYPKLINPLINKLKKDLHLKNVLLCNDKESVLYGINQ